jgi:hypothetical protein
VARLAKVPAAQPLEKPDEVVAREINKIQAGRPASIAFSIGNQIFRRPRATSTLYAPLTILRP